MTKLEKFVAEAARAHGFARVGFSRARRLDDRASFFADWLADGRNGTMGYLAHNPERRLDPRRIDPRFRSVISLAYPYDPPSTSSCDWRAELRGRIAAYAAGPDYHRYVRKAARAVGDAICGARPGALTRVHVDTGAIFQREWGAEGRVGWFGRNTMLLNREIGSYFFLAEILTDLEFDAPEEPYRDHCGTCRRCLDLCPTHALGQHYVIEPRLCLSYLTIEHRGAIPRDLRAKLGEWIFGCDICQQVCPWNDAAPRPETAELQWPHLPELLALDDESFSRRFSRSAVKRAQRRGLLRNVAIVLGNSGNPAAVPHLAHALENDPEPLVRLHCAWALGEIGGASARVALERARRREVNREAGAEIEIALSGTKLSRRSGAAAPEPEPERRRG